MVKVFYKNVLMYRVLCVILLIVYHSFAMFDGKWSFPSMYVGNANIDLYRWIARFSYSIMLESYVFIAGFLYVLQVIKKPTIGALVKNKFYRLILPCIIFGLIYIIFLKKNDYSNWGECGVELFNGVGHLWFLPMLFWCFIISYYFFRSISSVLIIFLITIFLSFVGNLFYIPFGISYAFKYLFYFVLGYYVSLYQDKMNRFLCQLKVPVILSVIYLGSFILYYQIKDNRLIINSILFKGIGWGITWVYKISGIFALYIFITIAYPLQKTISPFYNKIANYAFGIYIVHQMLLEAIYYLTSLPLYVNIVYLPILVMFITFLLSYIIAGILKRYLLWL